MSSCPYCGNHPVSHWQRRLDEYLHMALKPMDWLASTRVGHAMDVVSFYVVPVLVRLASLMHVITYNDDVQKAPNDRAKVLWEEAMQRGIVMRQLIFFGQPLDAYQARVNGRTIIFDGLPIPIHLRKKSLAWLDNKLQLKQFLQSKNIPVPRGGSPGHCVSGPENSLYARISDRKTTVCSLSFP